MMSRIFVFGSNLAGKHGAGAAKFALLNHKAIYGQGVGLQGTSYALPTKDHNIQTLSLDIIKKYVDQFLEFARQHSELEFELTPIGCGLAGYKAAQIKPMFINKPDNVFFSNSWKDHE